MTEILSSLLTLVALYGYPIVVATVMLGYIGIPVPSEGVLMAAGALTADGSLNFYLLIAMVTTVAICGDLIAFMIGKKYGIEFVDKFGKYLSINHTLVSKLSDQLTKWGIVAVFITRWFLTPLGIPLSLLCGMTNYSFRNFVIAVITGELLWVTIYVYLGYFLGSNWISIYEYLENFTGLLISGTVGIFLIYLSYKVYSRRIS